jgi:putative DeoR family transcriptional regulator (stage III sporulation protein D)
MRNNARIKQRILDEADYYVKNKSTLRETAEVFGVSKSTVHLDLTVRLRKLSKKRYQKVVKVIKKNKRECLIRATIARKQNMKNKRSELSC